MQPSKTIIYRTVRTVVFAAVSSILTSCLVDPPNQPIPLIVTNNSEQNIGVISMRTWGDVVLTPSYFENDYFPPLTTIAPGQEYQIVYITTENFLKEGGTVQVLVFEQSTLDAYSLDEIIRQDIYDKRYVLTYDKLVNNGFSIDYSGSDPDV